MSIIASVAQSVERTALNRTVAGLSPAGGRVFIDSICALQVIFLRSRNPSVCPGRILACTAPEANGVEGCFTTLDLQ